MCIVRFQVLTAASMMFRAVFWVILPCEMIVDQYVLLLKQGEMIIVSKLNNLNFLNLFLP
jgi:hypothetical protein